MVENRMRNVAMLLAAGSLALALELPTSGAKAQSPDRPTAQGQSQKPIPKLAWAPKPATPAPYTAPNRPIWRLSDLLAKHKGEQDWTETIVNTPHFIGQYISMGPGERTKTVFYADDRVFWVIESGAVRFTIEGQQPFVASTGFLQGRGSPRRNHAPLCRRRPYRLRPHPWARRADTCSGGFRAFSRKLR